LHSVSKNAIDKRKFAEKGANMLDLDEIKRHLQYMVLSQVAAQTGVDRGALSRIKEGDVGRLSHAAILKVSDFLRSLRS